MDNATPLYVLNKMFDMIPTILLVATVFVVGTTSNAVVLNNYIRYFKRSVLWYFVVTLVTYDFFVSFVFMPLEIVHIVLTFVDTNEVLCVFFRTLDSSVLVGCMWIIIHITMHQYVKVCHPEKIVSENAAKIRCVLSLPVIVILHLPFSFMLFGISRGNTSIPGVRYYTCGVKETAKATPAEFFYHLLHGFTFILTVLVVVFLFGRIAVYTREQRQLYKKHASGVFSLSASTLLSPTSSSTEITVLPPEKDVLPHPSFSLFSFVGPFTPKPTEPIPKPIESPEPTPEPAESTEPIPEPAESTEPISEPTESAEPIQEPTYSTKPSHHLSELTERRKRQVRQESEPCEGECKLIQPSNPLSPSDLDSAKSSKEELGTLSKANCSSVRFLTDSAGLQSDGSTVLLPSCGNQATSTSKSPTRSERRKRHKRRKAVTE
ncbi:hypothetical protein ACOMHN_041256 [Nucella lapillus]